MPSLDPITSGESWGRPTLARQTVPLASIFSGQLFGLPVHALPIALGSIRSREDWSPRVPRVGAKPRVGLKPKASGVTVTAFTPTSVLLASIPSRGSFANRKPRVSQKPGYGLKPIGGGLQARYNIALALSSIVSVGSFGLPSASVLPTRVYVRVSYPHSVRRRVVMA